ncbi:MAG: hypothetical protein QM699_00175 [Amaricoccus sp.]|uniref:hypothetical protein n=1 Tax=Amaricoccus sp. TaxID=1872485 RepID=UPI0039E5E579
MTDFGPAYQLAEIDTLRGEAIADGDPLRRRTRQAPTLRKALASPLGRAYLDWSPMPWTTLERADPTIVPRQTTVVVLRDPRFLGDVPLMRRGGRSPLTAVIELDEKNEVVAETMDGRTEVGGRSPRPLR